MAAPAYRRLSLYETLRNLHLTDNLKLCLDAGDRRSFEGGGDTWRDLSGGGYDFYRGSGTGSDAADPTHNGVSGRRTRDEYFSFDGGDWLTLAQSNPTWVNNLHKDNAKYTIASWFYTPNTATGLTETILGNAATGVGAIFGVGLVADGDLGMATLNGTTTSRITTASARLVSAQWNFLAASVDEGASSGVLQINGTQEAFSFSYTSPTAADAEFTVRIADNGNGVRPFKVSDRLGNLAAWEGVALSSAQLTAIYGASRARYGV